MSVYIIAEAGVNHNGDLEIAKQLVDMAKECGADAIKFQTFYAEESTGKYALKAEYQQVNDPTQESQYEMIKKLELPFDAFVTIKEYCEKKEIDFISTPDGEESLAFLVKLGVPLIKVGSSEVTNYAFLEQIGLTQLPIILSTGMSTLGEVEKALEVIKKTGNQNITLMHCTTEYPTPIKDVNLRAMVTMQNAFHLPIGYSDHTGGSEAAIAATTMGARYIEKHITLDVNMEGPDHKASMAPEDFKKYVKSIRNTEILLGDGIKVPTEAEKNIMKQVRRSILANRDLKAGTVLTKEMFCYKRPGDGIYPEYAELLVGKTLKRDLMEEEKIVWDDVY